MPYRRLRPRQPRSALQRAVEARPASGLGITPTLTLRRAMKLWSDLTIKQEQHERGRAFRESTRRPWTDEEERARVQLEQDIRESELAVLRGLLEREARRDGDQGQRS